MNLGQDYAHLKIKDKKVLMRCKEYFENVLSGDVTAMNRNIHYMAEPKDIPPEVSYASASKITKNR